MYQRILVPIDGSPTSTAGLAEAVALARLTGARVRLMHVVDEFLSVNGFASPAVYVNELAPRVRARAANILDEGRRRAEAAGVGVETQLVERIGTRLSELVNEQVAGWRADLVVIGTHGRRGTDRFFLGSDAEQIARTAKVPVLLVRAPGAAE